MKKSLALFLMTLLLPTSVYAMPRRVVRPLRLRESQRSSIASKTAPIATVKVKKVSLKTYRHFESTLSFKYPNTWKAHDFSNNRGASLSLIQENVYHPPIASIVIVADPVPYKRDYSLQELHTRFMNNALISNTSHNGDWYIPSFHLLSSGSTLLFGRPAVVYDYTGEYASSKIHSRTYITSFGQKTYRVSYHVTPSYFEQHLPVLEQVLSTLSWLPVSAPVNSGT